MGYVEQGVVSGPGDILQIEIRGTAVDAEIVERPFYKAR
jgi:glycine cleavage system aminomethyltransferase T